MRNGAAEVFQNLGVLDSLIVMEAATDNPGANKIDMLRRSRQRAVCASPSRWSNGPGRLSGRAIRHLLATIGLQHVGAA